jgi:hypothetical protein
VTVFADLVLEGGGVKGIDLVSAISVHDRTPTGQAGPLKPSPTPL